MGWVAKAVPAVAVEEGCWLTISLEALAELTLIPVETVESRVPEVKVSVTLLAALVTYSPLKLATPLAGIAV